MTPGVQAEDNELLQEPEEHGEHGRENRHHMTAVKGNCGSVLGVSVSHLTVISLRT